MSGNGRLIPSGSALRRIVRGLRAGPVQIRSRLLLEARLEELPRAAPAIPVHYRFGDVNDLERLSALDPRFDESAQRAARLELARGDRLVVGEHQGRVIFRMWIMFGAIQLGSRVRRMAPHRAYSHGLYTAPSYRQQRVASGVYAFLAPELAVRGCERLVCWVSARNAVSVRLHERLGYVPLGRFHVVRLIRWKRYWRTGHLLRQLRRNPQ